MRRRNTHTLYSMGCYDGWSTKSTERVGERVRRYGGHCVLTSIANDWRAERGLCRVVQSSQLLLAGQRASIRRRVERDAFISPGQSLSHRGTGSSSIRVFSGSTLQKSRKAGEARSVPQNCPRLADRRQSTSNKHGTAQYRTTTSRVFAKRI